MLVAGPVTCSFHGLQGIEISSVLAHDPVPFSQLLLGISEGFSGGLDCEPKWIGAYQATRVWRDSLFWQPEGWGGAETP